MGGAARPAMGPARQFVWFLVVIVPAAVALWLWSEYDERQKEAELDREAKEFCESVAITAEDLLRCDAMD